MYVFLKLTPLSAARARHIRLTCLRRCSPSACTWLRTVELGPWTLAKIIKQTNVRRVDRRKISTVRKFNQFLHHEIWSSWRSHESWVLAVCRIACESKSRCCRIPLDRRRSCSALLQITQWYFWYLCLLTFCENTCYTTYQQRGSYHDRNSSIGTSQRSSSVRGTCVAVVPRRSQIL